MKVKFFGLMILAFTVAACGGPAEQAEDQDQAVQQQGQEAPGAEPGEAQAEGSESDAQSEMVTVKGCLSSGEQNGYILTADPDDLTAGMAARGGGTVPTVTYQLVAKDAGELKALLGQQVQVRGRADEEPRATAGMEREKETPARPVAEGVKPQVETEERAEIAVKKLNVISVERAGGACPSGQ